ncbi:MAG: hypothetical protein HFH38_08560 [Lachnospiraceae bacterium]|jgi:hypothetical protein|nr:hypothetical protein [Lachnospiraceae bacterium]
MAILDAWARRTAGRIACLLSCALLDDAKLAQEVLGFPQYSSVIKKSKMRLIGMGEMGRCQDTQASAGSPVLTLRCKKAAGGEKSIFHIEENPILL